MKRTLWTNMLPVEAEEVSKEVYEDEILESMSQYRDGEYDLALICRDVGGEYWICCHNPRT